MADQFTYAKLPSDPCLTEEQMLAYIDGKLSAADQHACEKHMADCEMCEDAMEGLSLVKDRTRLASPIVKKSSSAGKVVPLQQAQPKLRLYYAAAAVLVVVLGSVFFLKNMTSPDAESSLADRSSKTDTIGMPAPVAEENIEDLKNDAGRGGDILSEKNSDGVLRNAPVFGHQESGEQIGSGAPTVLESAEGEVAEEYIMDIPAEDERVVAYDADVAKPELQERDEKLKEAEEKESDKKTNFWDRTKAGIPQTGGTGRAEQKQSLAKDDAGVDSRQDAPPAEAPKQNAEVQVTNAPVGGATDVSTKTETVNIAADSVTMSGNAGFLGDELEQSYQSGMQLMNDGQPNTAITMFDKVLVDKNHPRYEDAEFQKANALIKANRKEEAKTLLKSIETKKGKHAAEATELLKTL